MIRPTGGLDLSRFTVLLAEDDITARLMVARMLTNMGFKSILQAANGLEALEMIRGALPDLVIGDIEMEPMSGLEVLKTLRKSSASYERSLPFIFLTNHAESQVVSTATALGVNAFLLKPVNPDRLVDRVSRVLGGAARLK